MPKLPELTDIKRLREKLKLSQTDIALFLGIPQATISRIENGLGNPSFITVKRIFDYLEQISVNRKESAKKAKDIMTFPIISINPTKLIKDTVDLMTTHNVSQIPIIDNGQNMGSITAKKIQKRITENPELINAEVSVIKELSFPEIEKYWDIKEVSSLLMNYSAVLVKEHNEYIGIITDADLLKFIL